MKEEITRAEAARLKASYSSRIKTLAKELDRSANSLRYQIVFECFLKRVFASQSADWVLKGGTALLIRNGYGRFTQDIDLARAKNWESTEEIREQFERAALLDSDDPFTFRVSSAKTKSPLTTDNYDTPTVVVKLVVQLGSVEFQRIKVDVSLQRHTQSPVHSVMVDPLLNRVSKGLDVGSFHVNTTAIESHLADKICAIYEIHPTGDNTRYRDLADIVQIVRTQDFSADELVNKLEHEVKRRHLSWPVGITSPGQNWASDFEKQSRDFEAFPHEFHSLQNSLDFAGQCLNELLSRQRTYGRWNHQQKRWED